MNNQRQKFWFILIGLIMLALIGSSAYWLLNTAKSVDKPIKTSHPMRKTIAQKITAIGQIIPRQKVKIKSQANGILAEMLVKPGQWVKRGDLIARISLRADPVEINTVQAQINKAKLEHDRAEQELARQKSLHEQRLVSDTQLQDTQLKFNLTRSALDQAQRELELRMKGASQQLKTTSTLIAATMDGMVLERQAEIGDFIIKTNDLNEGSTIVTLANMHDLIFKGDVEEADAGQLKEGIPLSIRVGALPEQEIPVKLETIAPEARKTEQGRVVFEIRAPIPPQKDIMLRAGYSATAQIILARHENVLAVPENSLTFRDHKPLVSVETAPGKIVEQAIATGLSDGFYIEVITGLSEKDLMVMPEMAGAP
ncbi:MAG: efflux RND transporter periplasmic adaptor subunit [Methylococcaceae bacterium]|nr:efflux RND transporter periplasmic adaptor subunit [Methylococcaceae bacterium]